MQATNQVFQEAFRAELVRNYSSLRRYAVRVAGSEQLGEDLLHDAITEFLSDVRRPSRPEDTPRWIAMNIKRVSYRRRQAEPEAVDLDSIQLPANTPDPETLVQVREQVEALPAKERRAILGRRREPYERSAPVAADIKSMYLKFGKLLAPRQREVVHLVAVLGMSNKAAAKRLGISPFGIYSALTSGVQSLQRLCTGQARAPAAGTVKSCRVRDRRTTRLLRKHGVVLTSKQRSVVDRVLAGGTVRVVARALGVTAATARGHFRAAVQKAEAVEAGALRRGA